jgi:YHS domain-containing protein
VLRFFVILIVTALAITVLRSVMTLIARGFSDLMKPESPDKPTGGELKRDPVCGTYIADSNSVRKVVNGETLYFCSPECRDKYPSS